MKKAFVETLFFCLAVIASSVGLPAEVESSIVGGETSVPLRVVATNDVTADEVVAMLLLEQEMKATLRALEKSRTEADRASRQNVETLSARLGEIQTALSTQRSHELDAMQATNRSVLILATVFASFGLLAVLFTSFLQNRTLGRLSVAVELGQRGLLEPSAFPALGIGGATAALHPSTARLLGTIERLERRLNELEQAAPHQEVAPTGSNGGAGERVLTTVGRLRQLEEADQVTLTLGKGQALLNLGQAEEALGCFERVLAAHPDNADALMKRGTALEHLDRIPEALESYDRALAEDESLTMAYLSKGGIYNRLQRYDEALACYEKALKSERKTPLPSQSTPAKPVA